MNSMSLKSKFIILISTLLLFYITLAAIGIYGQRKISDNYARIEKESLPNTNHLLEMLGGQRGARIYLLELVLPGQSQDEINKFFTKIDENWKKYDEHAKAYEAVPFIAGEAELYEKVKKSADEIKKISDNVIALIKKSHSENSPEYKSALKIVDEDISKHSTEFREHIQAILDFHYKNAELFAQDAHQAQSSSTAMTLTLGIFGLSFGIIFSYILFSNILSTLKNLSSELNTSSHHLSSASINIARSADALSQASTEQASALGETAASMEEMRATVIKNTDTAQQANEISAHCRNNAEKGKDVVSQMIQAIDNIQQSNTYFINEVNISNQKIEKIVQVITEIGNKTKVINDIVFQTKLLSFNASVEAARAGEHGKGFAVVAEEVGNLATMSGNAAQEISSMLDGSIKNVQSIVDETKNKIDQLMKDSREKIAQGTETSNLCHHVFSEISTGVTNVAQLNEEISISNREQSKGVEEVNIAMGQLEQMTNQNTSNSQHSAHAAEELARESQNLNSMITNLVAFIEGSK